VKRPPNLTISRGFGVGFATFVMAISKMKINYRNQLIRNKLRLGKSLFFGRLALEIFPIIDKSCFNLDPI